MENVAVMILFTLVLLVGVVALQVFLSRRESKWLGLILPGVSLLIALMMSLGFILYTPYTVETSGGVEVDGVVIEQSAPTREVIGDPGFIVTHALSSFAMFNIPTIILLGIHFACREKQKKANAVQKMSIQDLE